MNLTTDRIDGCRVLATATMTPQHGPPKECIVLCQSSGLRPFVVGFHKFGIDHIRGRRTFTNFDHAMTYFLNLVEGRVQ